MRGVERGERDKRVVVCHESAFECCIAEENIRGGGEGDEDESYKKRDERRDPAGCGTELGVEWPIRRELECKRRGRRER